MRLDTRDGSHAHVRRGGAAVEFALTLPLLLLLTLPIIDYCIYFMNWQLVVEAAQTGARAGAGALDTEDPFAIAKDAAMSSLNGSSLSLASSASVLPTVTSGPGKVSVRVEVPYAPITGIVQMPTILVAEQAMLLENFP